MALNSPVVRVCGWEAQESNVIGQVEGLFGGLGGMAVSTSVKRTGAASLRANPNNSGGTGYFEISAYNQFGNLDTTIAAVTTSYFRFYARCVAITSHADGEPWFSVFNTAGGSKCLVGIASTGVLKIITGGGSVLATGTFVFSNDGAFHRVEVKMGTDAVAAALDVYVDGTLDMSITVASAVAAGRVRFGKYVSVQGNGGYDFYFDDFIWRDDALPGVGACIAMVPFGDSVINTGFTAVGAATKHAAVAEIPYDGNTSYIGSVLAAAYTATFDTCANLGITGTINAIQPIIVVEDILGASSVNQRSTSGGTNSDTTANVAVGAAYTPLGRCLSVDPTDSNPWTLAKANAFEAGINSNNTSTIRCTQVITMVDFSPSTFPTQFSGLKARYGGVTHDLCLVAEADGATGMGGIPKITKGGSDYAIYLVETTDPNASSIRMRTSGGTKAIRLKT